VRALERGAPLAVPAGALAQAWRGGAGTPLRALIADPIVRVEDLTRAMALAPGELCAAAGAADVVDASVVLVARRYGGRVATGDAADLRGSTAGSTSSRSDAGARRASASPIAEPDPPEPPPPGGLRPSAGTQGRLVGYRSCCCGVGTSGAPASQQQPRPCSAAAGTRSIDAADDAHGARSRPVAHRT
jgi:hypothetical protein